ncbi:hypothetical protein FRC00_013135, partial [Tulasnella sp. 408]
VARRSKVAAAPPSRPSQAQSQPTSVRKKKRQSNERTQDDARRLAKMAPKAGQKYTVTEEDKLRGARYLADAPKGVDWNGVLMGFVENVSNGVSAGHPSFESFDDGG